MTLLALWLFGFALWLLLSMRTGRAGPVTFVAAALWPALFVFAAVMGFTLAVRDYWRRP